MREELEVYRTQVVISRSEQETVEIGGRIAEHLIPGSIVALYGELGSGKTRIVQGICRRLEVADDVTSPSFTLINQYRGRLPVYHFDLFRIATEHEVLQLGYEEYFFGEGVCVIEWAERMRGLLPEKRIDIRLQGFFEPGRENERQISIKGLSCSIKC